MIFRFTAAGRSLFETNPTAFNVTRLVLTAAYGYTLADPPTALQGGSNVYDQTATLSKEVSNTNTLRYTKLLDNTVGDFSFGECGLYSGGTLVAVGVNTTPIVKTHAAGAENGNSITLNIFLSQANTNSYGFIRIGNSDNALALGQVNHVDYLDPPYEGEPNTYVVNGLDPLDVPSIGFSDVYGRWNFSSRPTRYYTGVVSGSNTLAVDIASAHSVDFGTPTDYVLQFISGKLRGYCRELTNIGTTFFAWVTPTLYTPEVGDQFIIVGPNAGVVNITGQLDIQWQDEGTNLGSAGTVQTVDFVGTGVTAARAGSKVTVTVPAGAAPIQWQDEGTNQGSLGGITTVNFVGAAVTADDTGAVLNVTIPAPAPAPAAIQFKEEGTNLGAATVDSVNFVGANVTATRAGNEVTVTVTGGGGGGTEPAFLTAAMTNQLWNEEVAITPFTLVKDSPDVNLVSNLPVIVVDGWYKVTVMARFTNTDTSNVDADWVYRVGAYGILLPQAFGHTSSLHGTYGDNGTFQTTWSGIKDQFNGNDALTQSPRWTDVFFVRKPTGSGNLTLNPGFFSGAYFGSNDRLRVGVEMIIERMAGDVPV